MSGGESDAQLGAGGAEHLGEEARAALSLSDKERILFAQTERWIGYSEAQKVLQRLEDLLEHPRTTRMPNVLIVGDTNNGKTQLVKRFRDLHPARDAPDGDGVVVPVLMVHAPDEPNDGRFYNEILDALGAPFGDKDSVDARMRQVYHLLGRVRVRMLIIDEIHDILGGSRNKHHQFLKSLKRLGNKAMIPLVGVGTQEAFNAVNADPQLGNRFRPAVLPLWKADREFRRLLASFERLLPLRYPSRLAERSLATKLHGMCEGTIGDLAMLLEEATVVAIRSGRERIDAELLDSLGWVLPSNRKRRPHP